jgi:hypothetical protein
MKMYIAVLDEVPDYMVPCLVAHAVLGAHLRFIEVNCLEDVVDRGPYKNPSYIDWLENSFKKCVVRVGEKEFNKILALKDVYVAHEKSTLDGRDSCAVVCPRPSEELPNVLRFAKLWKPESPQEPQPDPLIEVKRDFARDTPPNPPPYVPDTVPGWPNVVRCSKCHLEFSGVMGFVCVNQGCPMQLKFR